MRAAAKVEPVALLVDLDLLILRDRVYEFDLEQLTLVAEDALGLVARPHLARERLVARDDLAHFFLDRGKIVQGERLVAEEVVVEAVLDHRSDGHLRTRPQCLHRLRQDMGAVVPNEFERTRVFARKKFDLGVRADFLGQIPDLAVNGHRDRALGKRRGNAFGDVESGDAVLVLPTGAVGKGQRDHSTTPVAQSLRTVAGKRWSKRRAVKAKAA